MQFSEHDLRAAVTAGALDDHSLSRLLDFLATRQSSVPSVAAAPAPQFDLAHLLWYAGALIVMGAMGLFSTLAFSSMGGGAQVAHAQRFRALRFVGDAHLRSNLPLGRGSVQTNLTVGNAIPRRIGGIAQFLEAKPCHGGKVSFTDLCH